MKRATGNTWTEWFRILDASGAKRKSHAEIARYLSSKRRVSPWWSQMVTVRYEQQRGLRRVGETSKGWQASVSRTIAAPARELWGRLLRGAWLGAPRAPALAAGRTFRTRDGTTGEVRTARPGRVLRLRLARKASAPTTLEIRLTPRNGKTSIVFDHTGLPDRASREAMRSRWRRALDSLEEHL